MSVLDLSDVGLRMGRRVAGVRWSLVLNLALIAGVGVTILYSVAGGQWQPWALTHALRFAAATVLMLALSLVSIDMWKRLAYFVYGAGLILLVAVETNGTLVNGARRWVDVGPVHIQPSEIMKIGIVLALAAYYHDLTQSNSARRPGILQLIPALLLISVPSVLVFHQPDLGTAVLVAASGIGIVFFAGLSMRLISAGLVGAIALLPLFYFYVMKPYQRERVTTLFNPEQDPLGTGYHVIQSKIAIGSAGIAGKGFLHGTQAKLDYLPEKQTDFIFTSVAEEFGLFGAIVVLVLFAVLLIQAMMIAQRHKMVFAKLVIAGVVVTTLMHVVINIGMVMGLLPVVGVPLPLISHGGTAMITLMVGFGIVLSAARVIDRR